MVTVFSLLWQHTYICRENAVQCRICLLFFHGEDCLPNGRDVCEVCVYENRSANIIQDDRSPQRNIITHHQALENRGQFDQVSRREGDDYKSN